MASDREPYEIGEDGRCTIRGSSEGGRTWSNVEVVDAAAFDALRSELDQVKRERDTIAATVEALREAARELVASPIPPKEEP